jgi:hypothetical protein
MIRQLRQVIRNLHRQMLLPIPVRSRTIT